MGRFEKLSAIALHNIFYSPCMLQKNSILNLKVSNDQLKRIAMNYHINYFSS